ncbi:uncharacterized protein [Typha angustifolia]|uniref:uncharacterized protein n=1 Tax=Typha angustifolia TaxID=59011 RepID=UPI003C30114D
MDMVLCDELLQEIIQRLPPSSSRSISLVSRRWLFLLRSSTTSLSLRIPSSSSITNTPTSTADGSSTITILTPSFSTILSHYPFLSNLTVIQDDNIDTDGISSTSLSSDSLLLAVAVSPCSRRLFHLRFMPNSPVSSSALLSVSSSFTRLTSLHISSLPPLSLQWLANLPSLKSFSLIRSRPKPSPRRAARDAIGDDGDGGAHGDGFIVLPLESLSLSGIRAADRGLSWLWRRCGNLRWLQLRACDGTGDGPSYPSFTLCLGGLLGLELRTCRAIADRVLLHAADHCRALTSLLLYDGGSRDALRHFIHQRGSALRTLDLRLPLDLHNDHLFAIAGDRHHHYHRGGVGSGGLGLAALRLQSCCLVTGDGLRSLARAPAGAAIEELALVNCDVVEREPGLLTFLGQSMPRLRRLDLSHNETLADKEVRSMLASCRNLVDIRLRGCRSLTGDSLFSLLKHCSRWLEVIDISRCPGIGADSIETFALSAIRLNQMIVEEGKVSEAAKALATRKAIKIG